MSEKIDNSSTVKTTIVKDGVEIFSEHSTGMAANGFVAYENIPDLISKLTDIFIATKRKPTPKPEPEKENNLCENCEDVLWCKNSRYCLIDLRQ